MSEDLHRLTNADKAPAEPQPPTAIPLDIHYEALRAAKQRAFTRGRLAEAKLWCHNWFGYDNLAKSEILGGCQCRDCARVRALKDEPPALQEPK